MARVWDAGTGEPVTPPLRHDAGVTHVEFGPDGRRLHTVTEKGVRVWDAVTGEPITPLLKPGADVSAASFFPEAVLSDPSLRIAASEWWWPAGSKVSEATFTADGRGVVTLHDTNWVHAWDLSPDERPLEDLTLLARLLSGREIDRSGASSPRPAWEADWQKLKTAYPDAFTVPAQAAVAWCQAEAGERERVKAGEASLYGDRGTIHAQQAEWDKAAADFATVLEKTPADVDTAYRHALACLGAEDLKGYRKACTDLVARLGPAPDPDAAYWAALACGLGPDAVADFKRLVQLAERYLAGKPKDFDALNVLGAVLHRSGQFDKAVQRLNEAVAAHQRDDDSIGTIAYTWFFLAMAQQQLGHADQARQWLARAVEKTDQITKNPYSLARAWNRWLTLQLLRGEAESLINGKPANPKK
jgi:tetratricopeptide (TPR) repeat protein